MISSGIGKRFTALVRDYPLPMVVVLLVVGAGAGAFAPGAFHKPAPTVKVSQAQAYDPQLTVYRTPHGRCYHLDGCMALHGAGIPLKLADVVANGSSRWLRPCSMCNPPFDPTIQQPLRKARVSTRVRRVSTRVPRISTRVPREPVRQPQESD